MLPQAYGPRRPCFSACTARVVMRYFRVELNYLSYIHFPACTRSAHISWAHLQMGVSKNFISAIPSAARVCGILAPALHLGRWGKEPRNGLHAACVNYTRSLWMSCALCLSRATSSQAVLAAALKIISWRQVTIAAAMHRKVTQLVQRGKATAILRIQVPRLCHDTETSLLSLLIRWPRATTRRLAAACVIRRLLRHVQRRAEVICSTCRLLHSVHRLHRCSHRSGLIRVYGGVSSVGRVRPAK